MWSASKTRLGTLGVALLLACTVQAQQSDPSQQQPATPPPQETQPAQPGNQPVLGGAENFSLWGMGGGRSFFLASLRFSQGFDTNSSSTPGSRQFRSQTALHGNISLDRMWSHSQLTLNYSTGGMLYANASGQNSPAHNFGLTTRFTGRRASLTLSDSFSLLPESSFGFGGFGGIGNLGGIAGQNPLNYSGSGFGQGNNLDPFFTPDQSILTSRGKRISNTVTAQVNYAMSARDSLVFSAGYGIMRFLEGAFIESDNITGRLSYTRMLNPADSLGFSYMFNQVEFSGIDRHMQNHSLHLVYGRRLTGRMAIQLSGGPMQNRFRNPVQGTGRRNSWSTRSTLTYQFATADMSLGYTRQSTGGSGVLIGADSHMFDGSFSKQISRMWDMGLNFGYAHNRSLRELAIGPSDIEFNTARAGVTFSRPINRSWRLFTNYNYQWQAVDLCTLTGCIPDLTRHHFALGLSWQSRPIALE